MHRQPPIDIVYLWVNGNDSAWRARRHRAASNLSTGVRDAMAVYSNVEGRFRDNDELRFSLRALERYFPAHGHVYIVTDAQRPAWLRASSRVTVIDHRDLIPAARLPTFDSGNIESYIHCIPTLSERYFYLNDDMFFGAPVHTADWFQDVGVYVAWSDEPPVSKEPPRPDATALENACRLSSQWLEPGAGVQAPAEPLLAAGRCRDETNLRMFAHAPRPMLKSVLQDLEKRAPEMFEAVRSTVFRTWDKPPIVSDFVQRWALAHGLATVRDYRHLYVSTGDAALAGEIDQLIAGAGRLDFFCINDTTDDAGPQDPRLIRVREALKQMFPHPSSFERATSETQHPPVQAGNENAHAEARAFYMPT